MRAIRGDTCDQSGALVADHGRDPGHRQRAHDEAIVEIVGSRHLVGIIARRLGERPSACPAGCDHALDHALITAPDKRDPALVARLDAVAGRVLGNRA